MGVVRWSILASVALAALSLLWLAQPTYDPTAWLIWGREIVHGDLSTTFGPSWKPLPAVVTIPTGLLSLDAQHDIWLVIARTGTLMTLVLGFRMARRLDGVVAGVLAVLGVALAKSFFSFTWRGDSEGLLAALVIGAYEAHAARRRRLAFALIVLTGLIRPEMLVFVAAYGLLLVRDAPPRARAMTFAVLGAIGLVIVAAWLIPEEIGSGKLLRAASRAQEPVAGSPGQADRPFVATFTNATPVLMWPLYAGGIFLVGQELLRMRLRRSREISPALWVAIGSTVVMVIVALMAEAGFTGNIRYLIVASTLAAIVGAVGLARAGRLALEQLPRLGVPAGATPAIVAVAGVGLMIGPLIPAVGQFRDAVDGIEREAAYYEDLPTAIARAGGRDAVLACGVPYANPYDTQALARYLDVHEKAVAIHPQQPGKAPGMVFIRGNDKRMPNRRFHLVGRTAQWTIAASCAA